MTDKNCQFDWAATSHGKPKNHGIVIKTMVMNEWKSHKNNLKVHGTVMEFFKFKSLDFLLCS